jgi:hypothetical protein
VAAIWTRQDLPIPAGLEQLFKSHTATQAAPAARPLAPVQSGVVEQASKLQLSYQMGAQPPLEIAAETIAQAPDPDKE